MIGFGLPLAASAQIVVGKDEYYNGNNSAVSVDTGTAHAISSSGGTVELVRHPVDLKTSGSVHYGLNAVSGSKITIGSTGSTNKIETAGQQSYGINANASTVGATGLTIVTEGSSAHGIQASGSSITLTDVDIHVKGAGSYGISAGSSSTLTMTGGSITADKSYGVYINGNSQASLSGVTITATDREAIYADRGGITLADSRVTSIGSSALMLMTNIVANISGSTLIADKGADGKGYHAINVNYDGAVLHLSNSTVEARADNAYGIWQVGSNSPESTVTDSTIITRGTSSHGILVQGLTWGNDQSARMKVSGTTIHTFGNSAYGISAQGTVAGANAPRVTISDSKVITEGEVSAGITAFEASVMTGTNVDVTTKGTSSHGIYTGQRASLTLTGATIVTSGANAEGARAVGGTMALTNVSIKTGGDGAIGIRSDNANNYNTTVTLRNSSVVTEGALAHGVLVAAGGRMSIDGATVETRGANAAGLYFLGANTAVHDVTVTDSTIVARQGPGVLVRGASNSLTLNGTGIVAEGGTLFDVRRRLVPGSSPAVPDDDNPGHLSVVANGGVFKGAARPDDLSTLDFTLNNASWTITNAAADGIDPVSDRPLNTSRLNTLTVNDSVVAFAAPVGDTYHTLTVGSGTSGSSFAPGGAVVYNAVGNARLGLNTWFNEGGALANQHTDRLLVNGDVSGTTLVTVTGVAGSPGGSTSVIGNHLATEGISLIQVAGSAMEGSFRLQGGYTTLASMPYQYSLYAYGPGSGNGAADEGQRLVTGSDPFWDYRLQSVYMPGPNPGPDPDPVDPPVRSVAPQVASYLIAPTALFQAGQMDIANLHQRLGEIRDDRAAGRNGGTGEFFMRAYGGMYDYASNRNAYAYGYNANIDYAAMQMGGNLYAFETKNGVTRFGIAGSIGSLNFEPKNVYGSTSTRLDTWLVSAYGTYLHDSGWYVDGSLSFGGFDGNVSTSLRGRTAGLSGTRFIASLETGYPFKLGDGLVLEPQAQLIYQRLMFDRKIDADGFPVSLGNQDQVTARIGAKLSKTLAQSSKERLITVYAKANLLHSFNDGGRVFLGDTFRLGQFGSAIEGGVGINATLSKNLSLYADAAYQHRIGRSGVSGFTLTGGLRYAF